MSLKSTQASRDVRVPPSSCTQGQKVCNWFEKISQKPFKGTVKLHIYLYYYTLNCYWQWMPPSGSSCGTEVNGKPHDKEVMGSNPVGGRTFIFYLSFSILISQLSVLKQVPREDATATVSFGANRANEQKIWTSLEPGQKFFIVFLMQTPAIRIVTNKPLLEFQLLCISCLLCRFKN